MQDTRCLYMANLFLYFHCRHVENCKPEEQIALLTDDKYTKVIFILNCCLRRDEEIARKPRVSFKNLVTEIASKNKNAFQ